MNIGLAGDVQGVSVGFTRYPKPKQLEERPDRVSGLGRVSHRNFSIDLIAVSTPDPVAREKAGIDKVGNDPLDGALSESDVISDVTLEMLQGHIYREATDR